MQIKYFLLIGAVCAFRFSVAAQEAASSISGTIKSETGEPIPAVSVKIEGSAFGTASAPDGSFILRNLTPGTYSLLVNALGYKILKKEVRLRTAETAVLNFKLAEDRRSMQTVTVAGRSAVQEANRQAFNITAVDASKLYNTTLDISGALDRVAGIRVRESGGVGSNFNLSLNGFSGNHIRYFIDGIPMDNFGSSFQINNIPINIAERVEVYKGVVPMWLGSDALGGAVNIITGNRHRNYIDASYSIGSFNTHRSVLNTAFTSAKGLTLQLNAFQNYSDNNYKVSVEAADINTGAYSPKTTLRRFHDNYHNESLIAAIGAVNKAWADKLLLGITLGRNYKEIQTGARMASVFGGWHRRGSIIMPSLKYKKDNLLKGLDVTLNANYNLGNEQNIDTMDVRYDWFGNSKPNGTNGERAKTLYKYKNNNGLATAMANYTINETHSIALSNVYTTFNRKGSDVLNPANEEYERTKRTDKDVLGLGYNFNIKNKWGANLFGKYIYQKNINGNTAEDKAAMQRLGYGAALTWFVSSSLQLKTSYELTNRMPEAQEIFGDAENQEGNALLRPEKSDNVNLGMSYNFALSTQNRFSFAANAIYRHADNFIYNRLNNNQSRLIAANREGVSTWGGDAELRYSYSSWLSAGATVTYQYLQNLQKYEPEFSGVSPVYKDQMPNIPYFFGNGDVSVSIRNFKKTGNTLNLGYNLLYVHAFYLYWPSRGGDKLHIPQQLSHDLNAVYSLKNGRYNIGLEAKNLTNAPLYDNFSLQKPGRSIYLNLRYFLNKLNN